MPDVLVKPCPVCNQPSTAQHYCNPRLGRWLSIFTEILETDPDNN